MRDIDEGENVQAEKAWAAVGMAPRVVTTDPLKVFDVFQPGLRRGAERLPFDPAKRYFYVEHPEEGWRVYLRAACFIHEIARPFDATRFLVVKRTDGDPARATWEAPKGQMEGKDAGPESRSIMQLLRENIRREVAEEAKIRVLRGLDHTTLILQSSEPDFPENHFFQYHIFSAYAHTTQIEGAFQEFQWIAEHPAAFRRFRRDKREKDAVAWFQPGVTKLMGRWSPTLVAMYLKRYGGEA